MNLRPVHVAGIGQLPAVPVEEHRDETQLVHGAVSAALQDAGMRHADIGFVCSGSSDYAIGRPFSFATAIDAAGVWPPKAESHVEMDGAWALYEAWVRLQHGDLDTALVYAYGLSSRTDIDAVLGLQLDPYTVSPLGVSPTVLAGLQAQRAQAAGLLTDDTLDEVVQRAYAAAAANPWVADVPSVDRAASPVVATPLRQADLPRRCDGAAAVVLRVGGPGPRIDGLAHIADVHHLGLRDLADSPSARRAGELARATRLDVAELCLGSSAQERILARALGLGADVALSPSGGSLVADVPMVSGLTRVCEAVRALRGGAHRALAHATTGPLLQHNLVCVLEAT